MAKSSGKKGGNLEEGKSILDRLQSLVTSFQESFFEFLGRFGLPGIVVLLLYFFVVNNATDAQKTELIDTWLLLKGEKKSLLVFGGIVIFVMVLFFGQASYCRKKTKILEEQLKKSEAENEKLQSKLAGKKLPKSKK